MNTIDRFRLEGRRAFVTGGSRGIGRAIALALADAGADVAIAARSAAGVAQTATEIEGRGRRALALGCDVADRGALASAFAEFARAFGACDIFVHAAGVASIALADRATREDLESMMRVHFDAGVHGSQLAFESMKQRGGSIVLVSSVWGIGAQPATLAYGAAKAALIQAVKVMAVEWARYRVRVNGVAPGSVDTDMTSGMAAEVRDRMLQKIPMRRFATPDEIAGPALFLCSEAASFVTGEVLIVDGGERAR